MSFLEKSEAWLKNHLKLVDFLGDIREERFRMGGLLQASFDKQVETNNAVLAENPSQVLISNLQNHKAKVKQETIKAAHKIDALLVKNKAVQRSSKQNQQLIDATEILLEKDSFLKKQLRVNVESETSGCTWNQNSGFLEHFKIDPELSEEEAQNFVWNKIMAACLSQKENGSPSSNIL